MKSKPVTLTEQDMQRLANVVSVYQERDALGARSLRGKLDCAAVVAQAQVSPLVVTMNSRVVCRDDAGTVREVTLVYPWHADANGTQLSVLAPLGRALLGAGVGDTVDVDDCGRTRRCWIYALHYQPEAAGRLEL